MIIHKLALLVIVLIFFSSCGLIEPIYGNRIIEVIYKNQKIKNKSKNYISNTDYIITPIECVGSAGGNFAGPFFLPIIPIDFDYSPSPYVNNKHLTIKIFTKFTTKDIPKVKDFEDMSYWGYRLSWNSFPFEKAYSNNLVQAAYGKLFDKKYQVKLIDTATGNELPRKYDMISSLQKSLGTLCKNVYVSQFSASITGNCRVTFITNKLKINHYKLEIYQNDNAIYIANIDNKRTFSGIRYSLFPTRFSKIFSF